MSAATVETKLRARAASKMSFFMVVRVLLSFGLVSRPKDMVLAVASVRKKVFYHF